MSTETPLDERLRQYGVAWRDYHAYGNDAYLTKLGDASRRIETYIRESVEKAIRAERRACIAIIVAAKDERGSLNKGYLALEHAEELIRERNDV